MIRTKRWAVWLTAAVLTVSLPALAHAADPDAGRPAPNDRHHLHGQELRLDWSAFPADIQAMKAELDGLRERQRAIFEQMKAQRDSIREAHRAMSAQERQAVESKAKAMIGKLRKSRDAIRSLRGEKHQSWEQFRQHTTAKQWNAAKADLKRIIDNKKRIMAEQQAIVKVQEDIAALFKASGGKKG